MNSLVDIKAAVAACHIDHSPFPLAVFALKYIQRAIIPLAVNKLTASLTLHER